MSSRERSASVPPRRRMASERRLLLLILSSAIPALVLFSLLPSAAFGFGVIAAMAALLAWIVVVANKVHSELLHHLRTLNNLVESTRMQDYSMKGARAREPGELGELYQQINSLAESLKVSHESERELLALLEKVVSQINVAIIVLDSRERIRLVNRLASALLKQPAESLIGRACAETILAQLPTAPESGLIDFGFPGAQGRWQVRQYSYRHHGELSRIVFIADLKQVLADEEIAAWQKLIRVISHEINNSLTPITSLCQTLSGLLAGPGTAHHADVCEGLKVIAERARGLQEFISVYARLARLPEPQKIPFPAADLAANLRRIFAGEMLEIAPFPELVLFGDPVQLEQLLINLVKNALEANPRGGPPVELSCRVHQGRCEFQVADRGAGIANPANLFVPFYTTKVHGAGIGLVLCRQIASRHHGELNLENRCDGPGAVARLTLPLPPAQAAEHGLLERGPQLAR